MTAEKYKKIEEKQEFFSKSLEKHKQISITFLFTYYLDNCSI